MVDWLDEDTVADNEFDEVVCTTADWPDRDTVADDESDEVGYVLAVGCSV